MSAGIGIRLLARHLASLSQRQTIYEVPLIPGVSMLAPRIPNIVVISARLDKSSAGRVLLPKN